YPVNREEIQKEVNTDREKDDANQQLTVDIDRGDYYIADTALEGSATERLQTWDNFLTGLACTDAQNTTLASICSQRTFASILCHVQAGQSAEERHPPQCAEQQKSTVEYRINRNDTDNTMVVRGRCVLDIAARGSSERLEVLLT